MDFMFRVVFGPNAPMPCPPPAAVAPGACVVREVPFVLLAGVGLSGRCEMAVPAVTTHHAAEHAAA